MDRRLELQRMLVDILGSDHVYFQPPASIQMKYPCIVYHRDFWDVEYADNNPYAQRVVYQVTVIDPNPDSLIAQRVAELPTCRYERFFAADHLNHDVFRLFF